MFRFSSFIFTTAFLFFHASSERAVDWFSINCPSASTDQSCTYTNTKTNDIAVSLFFQVEDNNGAWFQVASPSRNTRHRLLNLAGNTCPSPMTYSMNGQEHRCLFTGISFPSQKVQEYCDYLSQGYEGFTYPDADNPGYKCPSSFAPGKNSEGTDFCVYDIPKSYTMPKGARPYCSSAAFAAGELGFVWGKATPAPSHSFVNGSTVYCGRQWTSKQSGSAGDCFFILGAGKSFAVTGRGNVNMIGAHAVELNGQTTMKNAVSIECPASGKKSCSYVNGGKTDMYISAAFRSTVDSKNWMRCSYSSTRGSTINVCAYSSINAQSSSSSCSFILPAGKRLTCSSSDGLIVDTVSGVMMDKSYLSQSEPMNAKVCPPTTYPNSTMCDCYYTNSDMNNDVAVIMEADNTDNQYNSFHCYVWGINVCAWGANSNNRNDSGSCYFVLPAGASYNCSMQWGATAFTSTTIMKLQGTLFKPPHVDSPQRRPKGVVLPPSRSEKETMVLFQKWKTKFNKNYATLDEEQSRFENFRHFLSLADNMADRNVVPFERLNEMADLSQVEFEKFYRGCAYPIQSDGRVRVPTDFKLPVNLPTSVDWRTSGAIVPVKNQGQCGSCWAFSTTGVLSSTWYLKGNRPLTSLSEQTLVSCENDCDGCGGGWPYRAIDWVKQNGIDTEASYPYTSGGGNNGNCQESSHARANISVKGYKMLANNEDVMAAYVAQYGPVSISLDAMTQLWWPYTGGIMTGCCNKEPDHAVLIVGYGSQNGKKYWLIKNSWGTSWGIDGYIHLERGTDQCGITVAPVVPEM